MFCQTLYSSITVPHACRTGGAFKCPGIVCMCRQKAQHNMPAGRTGTGRSLSGYLSSIHQSRMLHGTSIYIICGLIVYDIQIIQHATAPSRHGSGTIQPAAWGQRTQVHLCPCTGCGMEMYSLSLLFGTPNGLCVYICGNAQTTMYGVLLQYMCIIMNKCINMCGFGCVAFVSKMYAATHLARD